MGCTNDFNLKKKIATFGWPRQVETASASLVFPGTTVLMHEFLKGTGELGGAISGKTVAGWSKR